MTNINTAFAHSFPASWKGPFTHAQPEQQTNRTSWRFVHGWRGISQRVISCWWTFGRLRAIASSKRRLSSDGYHRQLSELPHRHSSSKQTEGEAKQKDSSHCKTDGFYQGIQTRQAIAAKQRIARCRQYHHTTHSRLR